MNAMKPWQGDTLPGRFIAKVKFTDSCPVPLLPGGGCWIWTATKRDKHGYGGFSCDGKSVLAHTFSYLHFRGPIPDTYELDHLCRTPSCVNPWHLEPVTHKVNMSRGAHAMKTHCPRGHRYDEANTRVENGCRNCIACRIDSQRRSRLELPAMHKIHKARYRYSSDAESRRDLSRVRNPIAVMNLDADGHTYASSIHRTTVEAFVAASRMPPTRRSWIQRRTQVAVLPQIGSR